MNDRIRQLSDDALNKAVPYTWTKLDYDQIQKLLACHAELVIRECANIALREDHDPYECIMKHFGVEE
jgi:hypothetical protein